MADKGYVIVEFIDENSYISEIPICWLNNEKNLCFWPPSDERSCIKLQKIPETNWTQHRCKLLIMKTIASYESATRMCADFSSDSQLNSSDDFEYDNPIKKKKRNYKAAAARKEKINSDLSDSPQTSSIDIDIETPSKFFKNSSECNMYGKENPPMDTRKTTRRNLSLDFDSTLPSTSTPKAPTSGCFKDDTLSQQEIVTNILSRSGSTVEKKTSTKKGFRGNKKSALMTEMEQKVNHIRITEEDMKNPEFYLRKLASGFNEMNSLFMELIKLVVQLSEDHDKTKRSFQKTQDLEGFNIPFLSLKEFIEFDNRLSDDDFFKKVVNQLEQLGNKSRGETQVDAMITEIMTRSFPNDIASHINIRGSDVGENDPGWKFSLGNTSYMKAIISAVRNRHLCPRAARRRIVEWLKMAKWRKGGTSYQKKLLESKSRHKTKRTPDKQSVSLQPVRKSPRLNK